MSSIECHLTDARSCPRHVPLPGLFHVRDAGAGRNASAKGGEGRREKERERRGEKEAQERGAGEIAGEGACPRCAGMMLSGACAGDSGPWCPKLALKRLSGFLLRVSLCVSNICVSIIL